MPGGAALAGKPRRCTCAVDRLPARAVGTNDHKYDRDAYGASHTLAPLGRLALIHDIFGGFVFTSTPGSILVSVEETSRRSRRGRTRAFSECSSGMGELSKV